MLNDIRNAIQDSIMAGGNETTIGDDVTQYMRAVGYDGRYRARLAAASVGGAGINSGFIRYRGARFYFVVSGHERDKIEVTQEGG